MFVPTLFKKEHGQLGGERRPCSNTARLNLRMSYREQRSHAKSNRKSLASINRPPPMAWGICYDEVVAHHPIGIPAGFRVLQPH
jgi:hypothetical protein